MNLTFDLETAALTEKDMPFLPPFFNEKVGTPPEFTSRFTADLEARERDIADKRRAWLRDEEQKLIQKRVDFMEQAALSPDFGRIVAAGHAWSKPESEKIEIKQFYSDDPGVTEKEVIENLLSDMADTIKNGDRIAGFNIIGFDIPFLYWRAIVTGVDLKLMKSAGITFDPKWGLRVDGAIFDLITIAKARPFRGERAGIRYDSLDSVARALGLGGKEKTGDMFATMPREKQIEYLDHDMILTTQVAKRLLPFF